MGSYVSHRCVIAIDGPAASGKSSVARKLARQLGFIYVNSGAIYRAITWHLLQNKIRPEESERISEALDSAALACVVRDGEARIVVNEIDPAQHLRDDRVNENVSRVSRLPQVREIVSQRLHDYAECHDVVIEGRDIGSVVFPTRPTNSISMLLPRCACNVAPLKGSATKSPFAIVMMFPERSHHL